MPMWMLWIGIRSSGFVVCGEDRGGVTVDVREATFDVGDVGGLGVEPPGEVRVPVPSLVGEQLVGVVEEDLGGLGGHHGLGPHGTGDEPVGSADPLGGVVEGADPGDSGGWRRRSPARRSDAGHDRRRPCLDGRG